MWMNLDDIMLMRLQNKPDTKREILYDSTYMKYTEESNSETQKVE